MEGILKLEFMEMSEMLPETWLLETRETASGLRRMVHRAPITEILVLVECFSLMAVVLTE